MTGRSYETLKVEVLAYVRQYGMPSEHEVPPGLSSPLTPTERQWIEDMLAAEGLAP